MIRTHACLWGAAWREAACSPAPTSLHPATHLQFLVPCLAGQRDRHHIREGDAASSLSGGHEQPLPMRAPTRLRFLSPTRGSPHVAAYQAPTPTGQGRGPDPHSPLFGLLKHQVSVNRAQRKGAGPTGGPLGRTGGDRAPRQGLRNAASVNTAPRSPPSRPSLPCPSLSESRTHT